MTAPRDLPLPETEARAREVLAGPLPARLGIVLDRIEAGEVIVTLPFDPGNRTLGDVVHGGAIATLADVTGVATALCGLRSLPDAGGTATLTVSYLAPAIACDLTARGILLRAGRTQCVARVGVTDPAGRLVAEAQVTVAFV